MAACQAEEDATTTPEDTMNQDATTTASSSTPEPETLTTLSAWGDNRFSALGDGTYGNRRTTPVKVSNLEGAELKAISAGGFHSLALKNDGTVLAWGDNQGGQLGNGTNANSTAPVRVGNLGGVEVIPAGSRHSLAAAGRY